MIDKKMWEQLRAIWLDEACDMPVKNCVLCNFEDDDLCICEACIAESWGLS